MKVLVYLRFVTKSGANYRSIIDYILIVANSNLTEDMHFIKIGYEEMIAICSEISIGD